MAEADTRDRTRRTGLERGAGQSGVVRLGHQATDWTQGATPKAELADLLHSVQIEKVEPICLLPCGLQATKANYFREVEERAGDCRRRDPSPHCAVLWMKPASMDPDAFSSTLPLPSSGRRDVHRMWKRFEESP